MVYTKCNKCIKVRHFSHSAPVTSLRFCKGIVAVDN